MQIAQHTCEVVELRRISAGTVQIGIRPVEGGDPSAPQPTPGFQHYLEVDEAAAPALGAQVQVTYTQVTAA